MLLSCLSILLRRSKLMMLIKLPVRLSFPLTMTLVLSGLKDGSHLWNAWRKRKEINCILVLIFFVKIPKHYTEYPHEYLEHRPTPPPLDITLEHSKGKQPSHGNLPGNGNIKNRTQATRQHLLYIARKAQTLFVLTGKKNINKQKKNKSTPVIPQKTKQKSDL